MIVLHIYVVNVHIGLWQTRRWVWVLKFILPLHSRRYRKFLCGSSLIKIINNFFLYPSLWLNKRQIVDFLKVKDSGTKPQTNISLLPSLDRNIRVLMWGNHLTETDGILFKSTFGFFSYSLWIFVVLWRFW